MNRRQKLVQKQFLNNEQAVIGRLEQAYGVALKDIDGKIEVLMKRFDPDTGDLPQSVIYQLKYQEMLKTQVEDALKTLHTKQFLTVSDYLDTCYEDGFIGSMFDLQGQGVPMVMPINPESMVQAVQLDSKISEGLYTRLGEDVGLLKKKITAQVSRSIATGISYEQTAKALAGYTRVGYNNAIRIARTEGHRIQCRAADDVAHAAKDRGADIVKQWDATLDGATRESHIAVDGEIRELDEKFSNGLEYPGDPAGGAAEVVNCRCAYLQRARWALGGSSTKWNNFTDQLETFDSPEAYDEFKTGFFSPENRQYMNYVEDLQNKYGTKDFKTILDQMTDREYQHYSKLLANNPVYNKSAPKEVYDGVKLGEIGTKYRKKHVTNIQHYMEDAPLDVRNVWNTCADDFHVLDAEYRGNRAYYSAYNDGVVLNMAAVAKGNTWQTPYQTVFHEFGHHSDYILNRKFGDGDRMRGYSETYKNGIFGQTLKREATKAVDDFADTLITPVDVEGIRSFFASWVTSGIMTEEEVEAEIAAALAKTVLPSRDIVETLFCKHIKDTLSPIQRSDISDMFEPAMSISRPFGFGHGTGYWANRDNGKEAFAEMFSASVNNPESLEQIKRFFPESYNIFCEMLGVVQ
jgi:hypothetical protein